MKKILILLTVLILNASICFAHYKPIPASQQAQYKADIEQIIDREIPKAKKDVDKVVRHSKKLHDKLAKNGYDFNDYHNLLLSSEISIWAWGGRLDTKLIKFTQEKYFKTKYDPTDLNEFYEHREYLYRNFKETGVNTQKITDMYSYTDSQDDIIKNFIKDIQSALINSD